MKLTGKVIAVLSGSEYVSKKEHVAIKLDDAQHCFDVVRVPNIHGWHVDQLVWLDVSAFAPVVTTDESAALDAAYLASKDV
jgi:hypothetical protein